LCRGKPVSGPDKRNREPAFSNIAPVYLLESDPGKPELTGAMIATISSKGQLVIPEALREQARLKQGDTVDIGYADGLIVVRKRRPLTPARVRALLSAGRDHPEMKPADEAQVDRLVHEARATRGRVRQ
jgi:AbrB family looped-hinge helix DNA binding protein